MTGSRHFTTQHRRAIAGLVDDRSRLTSIADRPLAKELNSFEFVRDRSTAVLTELVRLVQKGKLDPHVTDIRPLSDAKPRSPSSSRATRQGRSC
jgi:hypothetical protein